MNTVIVLCVGRSPHRLAPVIVRWRPKGFAPVLDREQVSMRACRRWSSTTSAASIASSPARIRLPHGDRRRSPSRVCPEASRCRCGCAPQLEHTGDTAALARMMTESLKTFLIVIRHLRACAAGKYCMHDGLAAGQRGPAARHAAGARASPRCGGRCRPRAAGTYVEEVERVAAVVAAYRASLACHLPARGSGWPSRRRCRAAGFVTDLAA